MQPNALDITPKPIAPMTELGAYEALWDEPGASFKTLAEKFKSRPDALPSDFVALDRIQDYIQRVNRMVSQAGVNQFGIRVHGEHEYPQKLRDAQYPIEVLYYQGHWDLVYAPCVAIVGSRSASTAGIQRAQKLAKLLVQDGYTIVSGLAKGIDTAAHQTAIQEGGNTIAVIGTPLTQAYPQENSQLQDKIRQQFLLISQVPFYRYVQQHYTVNRFFFPERNKLMAALTDATIIVEAGKTSGTRVQAKAALAQGRKLFILNNCFDGPGKTWVTELEAQGAIRVADYQDIKEHLPHAPNSN